MSSPWLALLLLPAAALAGCAVGDDGPRTTQTRDIPAFTAIDNHTSVDVRLHVGAPQRVQVRAGTKVIDDVHTDVRGGTLDLTYDHHGFGGNGVVVEAWVPKLTKITANGSGDISAEGIDTDALQVRTDGSADLNLQGNVNQLAVNVDGSGDAGLADLAAHAARVSAGGSGDVDVSADQRLDVAIDGSGDVHYRGAPELTRHIAGSGDISRAH